MAGRALSVHVGDEHPPLTFSDVYAGWPEMRIGELTGFDPMDYYNETRQAAIDRRPQPVQHLSDAAPLSIHERQQAIATLSAYQIHQDRTGKSKRKEDRDRRRQRMEEPEDSE